jgi:hypothetical protein
MKTCGGCRFYRELRCHANPPSVFYVGRTMSGGVASAARFEWERPCVVEEDLACQFYRVKGGTP